VPRADYSAYLPGRQGQQLVKTRFAGQLAAKVHEHMKLKLRG
jgi:hypothetical protein